MRFFFLKPIYKFAAVAVLSLGAVACACDGYAISGLRLDIVDARTGEFAGADAVVNIRGRGYDFTDSIAFHALPPRFYLSERPGTYTVTISKPGYQTWQRNDVRVREEGITCPHVKTTQLTARLEPLNAAIRGNRAEVASTVLALRNEAGSATVADVPESTCAALRLWSSIGLRG